MPIYSYACPQCGVERTGLFKVDAPAPRCDSAVHLVPAQDAPEMVKQLSTPGFQVNGKGAYSNRSY